MAKKEWKPRLIPVIKKLEIATKGLATTALIGRYRSSFRGHGLEFDSYRSYMPDDDASLIDWKATARSDDILVKQLVEERNLNVFLMVDVSSTMLYGSSAAKLKIIYAAELAASLCYAILKAQDSVGFALFSDHVLTSAAPTIEPQVFYQLCKGLLNTEYYGGRFDLSAVLDELIMFLPEKTILIIISDFIGLRGEWEKKLGVAGKKFDIIGIMLRDIFDRTLPTDEVHLLFEDPYEEQQLLVNPSLMKRSYELHAREEEAYVKHAFKRYRGDMLVLTNDKPFVKPLITFFKQREKRFR